MLINYFKIAFRNLLKRKSYFLLNVGGITIGMTCCLLIFHYVSYEASYDEHIPDAGNIFRLRLDSYQQGELAWKSATVYPAIAPAMKRDFPEVKNYCRIVDAAMLLTNETNHVKFSETKGYFAEQSFIPMFGLQFISGDPSTALSGPDKILISETMAKKYFGDEAALGKKLIHKFRSGEYALEVSGVFKPYPGNAHLMIEYLASFDTYARDMQKYMNGKNTETLFDWYDFYTYLQLQPGTDPQKLEAKFPGFCKKYMVADHANKTWDELHLLPVRDIHLQSNYNQEAEVNGNGQAVSFLFLIGIIIICIAWINYINLSTARSVERAKEVGVKKVLGALRTDLIRQFVVENGVINMISLLLSLGLFAVLLKPFDNFTGHEMSTGITLGINYWMLFGAIFFAGTLLSGLYPAFILSGFQPVKVLKGAFKNTSKGIVLRKGLIVFQFMISVVLIAGTIIVYQQITYMRNQELGAAIDQTLVIEGVKTAGDSLYKNSFSSFKEELVRNAHVKAVAASSVVLGQETYATDGVKRVEANDREFATLYIIGIDYDFVPLYGMKLLAGRNFSKEFVSDNYKKTLLNECAVKMMGFKNAADAVNKKVVMSSGDTLSVVGVLADYHHQGLQKAIDPMLISLSPTTRGFYSIKMDNVDMKESIAAVEKAWKANFPNDPFNYFFLDDNFNQQYKTDVLFGKVFGVFALLAILIACSGLLGLSAYNVLQRSKEIGVRKVLGASVQNILLILSRDFILLIVIAFLLAVPLGWYVMNSWLRDFAYHIHISWWVFVLAGLMALLIAISTIVLNAYRSVRENPVKSLRTE